MLFVPLVPVVVLAVVFLVLQGCKCITNVIRNVIDKVKEAVLITDCIISSITHSRGVYRLANQGRDGVISFGVAS